MAITINNADENTVAFIKQWNNPDTDFIEARTAGSTGEPKCIRLSKADMRHSARATNARFGITSSSILYMPLSAGYIAGKMMIVRAIEAGCILYVEQPSLTPLAECSIPHIDLLPVVPAQIPHLLASPWLARRVANLIIGGGAIDPLVEQAVIDAGYNAFATYGMTETCSHVALRPLGDSHFQAMPGISFGIDADNCLRISSGGYSWGTIQTNDVVDLAGPHHFIWRGRRDFVINSGGVKLYPEEIEKKLAGHIPGEFYITSTPHSRWGEAGPIV
ncbi:MAG: AMP-binding protein, partial [Muribaculaceae bacterium]|nr:AMP-binding protein [Muribaculaceae bacterium]